MANEPKEPLKVTITATETTDGMADIDFEFSRAIGPEDSENPVVLMIENLLRTGTIEELEVLDEKGHILKEVRKA